MKGDSEKAIWGQDGEVPPFRARECVYYSVLNWKAVKLFKEERNIITAML